MRVWEEKANRVWGSIPTAIALCTVGAGAALWAYMALPAPGISIAILGTVAAVMSLRTEMRPGVVLST